MMDLEFDEDFYLFTYPDVAQAVALGRLRSGRDHYERHGMREGRDPGRKLWDHEPGDKDRFYSASLEGLRLRTVADLNRSLIAYLPRLAGKVDAVVGVPRSGLLAANLVALHLNLPLMTVDEFLDGRSTTAYTRRPPLRSNTTSTRQRVMVVDDSSGTGGTMHSIKAKVAERGINREQHVSYMAVFGSEMARPTLDHMVEALPNPRLFEWNLLHHLHTSRLCIDMDGVLCEDPTASENDAGPEYLRFLENAAPKMLPSMGAGAIVTARLEKYRPQTEAWLSRHNVRFERLIMLNLPDEAERTRLRAHAKLKASVLKTTRAMLFVESDPGQALDIHQMTGRAVYCIGSSTFYPAKT